MTTRGFFITWAMWPSFLQDFKFLMLDEALLATPSSRRAPSAYDEKGIFPRPLEIYLSKLRLRAVPVFLVSAGPVLTTTPRGRG
jgi:hypothetical protein